MAPLVAILAGAAALRFAGLAHQSFWLDEAYTAKLMHHSFAGMLDALPGSESTPPLYYVLAWPWSHVLGLGEYGLRSLSALAGTLTVLAGWAAARRLAGPAAAPIAALLLAVNPLLWWFSQEARAYALATLLCAVALWCLAALLDRPERAARWWAGFAAAATAALLTHYFAAFPVAAMLLWLWLRAGDRRRTLLAAAPVVVAGLALIPLAVAQRNTGHAAYIGEAGLGRRLVQVPKQLLAGYASPGQVASTIAIALLALFAVVALRRPDAPARARTLLAVVVATAGAPLLLALAGTDYLNGRNLIVALPALAVVLGAGLAVARLGRLAAGALAALMLLVTLLVAFTPRFQREDWRGAARALGPAPAAAAPGSPRSARVVVVSPGSGALALSVYDQGGRPLPAAGAAVQEIDLVAIPRRRTGSGSEPPPRPATPPRLPPGFAPAGATYGERYTVLRFRARPARTVRPGELIGDGLVPGPVALVLQRG